MPLKNSYSKKKNKLIRKKRKRKRKIIKLLFIQIIICISIVKLFNKLPILSSINTQNTLITDKNNAKFTVCLDPGHGGYDVGSISPSGVYEKNVTLNIALKVGKILEENNIKVVYTRSSDTVSWPSSIREDLKERVNVSNKYKPDLLVSIHCNANTDPSFNGVETWSKNNSISSKKLAENIQNELVSHNYTSNRGVKYEGTQQSIFILKHSTSSAVLIETGFITNMSDSEFIISENGQAICSQAIADGILKYHKNIKK